jgi:hypothetical protein
MECESGRELPVHLGSSQQEPHYRT